jgi:hypothetical protein
MPRRLTEAQIKKRQRKAAERQLLQIIEALAECRAHIDYAQAMSRIPLVAGSKTPEKSP